jgi:hypothetical protein
VAVLAGQDAQLRRAGETAPLDIDAAILQQPVPGRCERRRMRHLAAGDQRERGGFGQAEQRLQPCAADFFRYGSRRATDIGGAILVPGRGQPIRREGDGQRSADDETEEASAGRADEPALDVAHELVDDCDRIGRSRRHRAAEAATKLIGADRRADGAMRQGLDIHGGVGLGACQNIVSLHGRCSRLR